MLFFACSYSKEFQNHQNDYKNPQKEAIMWAEVRDKRRESERNTEHSWNPKEFFCWKLIKILTQIYFQRSQNRRQDQFFEMRMALARLRVPFQASFWFDFLFIWAKKLWKQWETGKLQLKDKSWLVFCHFLQILMNFSLRKSKKLVFLASPSTPIPYSSPYRQ